jgi:hypothetical protein
MKPLHGRPPACSLAYPWSKHCGGANHPAILQDRFAGSAGFGQAHATVAQKFELLVGSTEKGGQVIGFGQGALTGAADTNHDD